MRVNRANLSIFDCTLSDIRIAKQRYKIGSDSKTMQTNQTNLTNQTNQTKTNYALKTKEITGSSGMISLISENEAETDEVDRTLLDLLKNSKKKLGPHEIYDSIPVNAKEPALTELDLFKRLTTLAASHPNNNSLDLTLAKIIILPPRGSSGGLIGFTQSLGEFNKFIGESLQIDVWYDEGNKWQRGFRVIWGNWKSQLDSMLQTTKTWNSNLSPDKLLYDFIGTSEAYTFQRKFNPSYSEDLLKTDFIIEKA